MPSILTVVLVWAVFFMKKILKFVCFCALMLSMVWLGTVIADRRELHDEIIRFHVVANSDSEEDQTLKLKVRDALVKELESVMAEMPTAEEAKAYILDNLGKLKEIANEVLVREGSDKAAEISMEEECFDARQAEGYTLPAGVYESLRVTIGDGKGHNWWCVMFPEISENAIADKEPDTAAGAGFSQEAVGALAGEEKYQIRFWVLDALGWIQNWIYNLNRVG